MRLTKQYAYALLSSISKEEAVAVYDELTQVIETFEQFPEYIGFLEFQPEEFKQVRSILKDDVSLSVLNFLEVLAQDGLLSRLKTIAEDYRLTLIEENLLFDVRVFSAKSLSEAIKTQLIQLIEARWGTSYLIEFRESQEMLGGIKLEVNGAVIDTTFRSRIDQIIREVQHGAKR